MRDQQRASNDVHQQGRDGVVWREEEHEERLMEQFLLRFWAERSEARRIEDERFKQRIYHRTQPEKIRSDECDIQEIEQRGDGCNAGVVSKRCIQSGLERRQDGSVGRNINGRELRKKKLENILHMDDLRGAELGGSQNQSHCEELFGEEAMGFLSDVEADDGIHGQERGGKGRKAVAIFKGDPMLTNKRK